MIFPSAHGINRLLKKSVYPKFAEKPVVYHDCEQVKALYAAAKNTEEQFTFDYFLKSGFRDGGAAHAKYSDVKGARVSCRRREPFVPAIIAGAVPKLESRASLTIAASNNSTVVTNIN